MADLGIYPLTWNFIAHCLASFCAGERCQPEQRRNNEERVGPVLMVVSGMASRSPPTSPRPHPGRPAELTGPRGVTSSSSCGHNGTHARPWTRRERERVATGVMSRGFTDIRSIAHKPEIAGDSAAAFERIRMIADACHNLPGAARPRRRGNGPDPLAWAWQTASPDQREWLVQVLQSLGLDAVRLDTVPTRHSPDHPRRIREGNRIWSRKRPDQIHLRSSNAYSSSLSCQSVDLLDFGSAIGALTCSSI
jgi:hypothetical protein